MFSMRGLECLVAIVEQGSLTQAAAVLHISQPALSHQIAAIERELGTPVIERLRRGIRPTAAGMGVTIVPFSALTPLPGATIRSLDPRELRDVIVTVAAPHDDLLRRFVADLKRRGLPDSRLQDLCPLGAPSDPDCAMVMPGDTYPVAAYAGCAP
jgi:DNA-binding transcriptional LysR family regulator